jgi:hypothetical protein
MGDDGKGWEDQWNPATRESARSCHRLAEFRRDWLRAASRRIFHESQRTQPIHICFGCGVALGSPPLTAQARSTFWDHRGKTLTAPVATAP